MFQIRKESCETTNDADDDDDGYEEDSRRRPHSGTRSAARRRGGGGGSLTSALDQLSTDDADDNELGQFQTEALAEALTTVLARAVLLGPFDRLRFSPRNAANSWSTLEATLATRLLFTAWDGSDGKESGDELDLRLPFCCHEVSLLCRAAAAALFALLIRARVCVCVV